MERFVCDMCNNPLGCSCPYPYLIGVQEPLPNNNNPIRDLKVRRSETMVNIIRGWRFACPLIEDTSERVAAFAGQVANKLQKEKLKKFLKEKEKIKKFLVAGWEYTPEKSVYFFPGFQFSGCSDHKFGLTVCDECNPLVVTFQRINFAFGVLGRAPTNFNCSFQYLLEKNFADVCSGSSRWLFDLPLNFVFEVFCNLLQKIEFQSSISELKYCLIHIKQQLKKIYQYCFALSCSSNEESLEQIKILGDLDWSKSDEQWKDSIIKILILAQQASLKEEVGSFLPSAAVRDLTEFKKEVGLGCLLPEEIFEKQNPFIQKEIEESLDKVIRMFLVSVPGQSCLFKSPLAGMLQYPQTLEFEDRTIFCPSKCLRSFLAQQGKQKSWGNLGFFLDEIEKGSVNFKILGGGFLQETKMTDAEAAVLKERMEYYFDFSLMKNQKGFEDLSCCEVLGETQTNKKEKQLHLLYEMQLHLQSREEVEKLELLAGKLGCGFVLVAEELQFIYDCAIKIQKNKSRNNAVVASLTYWGEEDEFFAARKAEKKRREEEEKCLEDSHNYMGRLFLDFVLLLKRECKYGCWSKVEKPQIQYLRNFNLESMKKDFPSFFFSCHE